MFFIIDIKSNQSLVFINIPIKFTLVFMFTGATIYPTEIVVFSIMLQCTISTHFYRFAIEPPIKQVEMMCGLMYP